MAMTQAQARRSAESPPPPELARAFRRLTLATIVLALLLVAVGGAVRATDSGLACPTWPGCFTAGDWLPPAGLSVWLEHTHRLVAGVLGIAVAALGVWALVRFRDRPRVVWPAVAAAVLTLAQALLGAVVVLELLQAELVTAHLGTAMAVVACLLYLAVHTTPHPPTAPGRNPTTARRRLGFARGCAVVTGLAFVEILLGGQVTGVGAGLAYPGVPMAEQGLIPPITSASEALHASHRLVAYTLALGVVALAVAAVQQARTRGTDQRLQHRLVATAVLAVALVAAQVALGLANLATELSALSVTPHLVVASWLWTALVTLTLLAYRWAPADVPDRGHAAEHAGELDSARATAAGAEPAGRATGSEAEPGLARQGPR